MIVIWRGLGIFAPIMALAFLGGTQALVNALGGPGTYEHNSRIWSTLALALGAAAIWFSGRYLNTRPRPVLVNKATGAEVRQGTRHTLFFAPMEYWAVPLIAFAAVSPFLGS
jgi:hypothetical protein